MAFQSNLLSIMITEQEARKILGKTYEKKSDSEVEQIIRWIADLCGRVIDNTVNK